MKKLIGLTRRVPASVPSLVHSPWRSPLSSSTKKTLLPTRVSWDGSLGGDDVSLGALVSRRVFAAVPSLAYNCRPCSPSSARKKTLSPTARKSVGDESKVA